MFKNAVFRLTLWYLVIIMFISLIFSSVLYSATSSELERGLRRRFPLVNQTLYQQLENERNSLISESKERLLLYLLGFNGLILVLSGAASYFLAKRTLRPIEEAHSSQSQFTADASHELRTPLASMKTEIEVALREKNLTLQEAKSTLQSNLEEIGKLEELSNALLTLSRFKDSEKEKTFTLVSLKEIVDSTVNEMKNLAKNKKINIKTNLTEVKLKGNENSLKQLLRILLDNAIKYSPDETEVKIFNFLQDNWLNLSIVDQGIGIEKEDVPKIFERFFRADSSRSKNKAFGYGLGLSIAKQIVDLHQGKIEIESFPDKGSTFLIKLPLQPPTNIFSPL